MSRIWMLCAIAALALHGNAAAEETESGTIVKGRWSLAFALPEGGGRSLGVWKMLSGRSNVGVQIGIEHEFQSSSSGPDTARMEFARTEWAFSIQPSIKRYLVLRSRVSPFLTGSLRGEYGWFDDGVIKYLEKSVTVFAGLGADWTPLGAISIGAATGMDWTESTIRRASPGAPKYNTSLFNSMTSSLMMHLYF